jgi:hypothetical protein
MSRSIIRRNKWVVLAGVLLVLSVILSLLVFGQTSVRADSTTTLTVNFPGISSVHTYVRVDDGVAGTAKGTQVASQTYKTDAAVFNNLPTGTYDVVVVKGAQTLIKDAVVCNGPTDTVNNIVCTLTVKFPGISSVHTYVKVDNGVVGTATGGDVENQTNKTDNTSMTVLKGTYDVVVMKGAKSLIIDAVACTGDTALVDDIVCTLTVKFPGISSVHTYVKVDDGDDDSATGGAVEERTYKNNESSMVVLKNTYDVVVVKGAKTKIIDAVDCEDDTALVDDIVCTLIVNFPGISSVHTYVKVDDGKSPESATGGDVDNRTYQNNESSMVVLKNTYDVKVVKGAKTLIIDAVDCTGDEALVDDIVCTLTVKFPGSSGVHTYVKVDDDVIGTAAGGDVDNRTYKTEETSIVVLKNTYDVVVVKGTRTFIVDAVNCTGDTALVIIKGDQTITFGALADKTYGDADFAVSATSSAGLEVSFTASGACTISGTTVHITGLGSCTITAYQVGNIYYNEAPDVSRSFNVNKKPITVTADSGQTKVYGEADPTFTCSCSDLSVTFTGALDRVAGEDADSYAIGQGTLDAGPNYTITFVSSDFSITPAALNIKADDKSKDYGAALPTLTVTYTGLVNGDTAPATSPTISTIATSSSPVGTYPIIASGASDPNYTISYTDGTLTVTKASTTVVLTSSNNPSIHLLPVTFTATVAVVAPGVGTPTGTVTFRDGTTTLGTATLSSGKATYRTPCIRPLRLGDHSITAVYNGDANFTTSTSPAMTQTVLSLLQWILRLLGH